MLVLKEDKEHRIVMMGFRSMEACISTHYTFAYDPKYFVRFYGDREELLEKGESFWKEIVERIQPMCYYKDRLMPFGIWHWKNYGLNNCITSALESGHSALSQITEQYILIVKEKF